MSSIYKLSISGIRSFSDETQETIQFGKPLTLIVGTNGSGKTTIIECLRYATTNELPPNTKNGASFINDPNLHSSNETKAQIKLAFQNTKKVNLILSKSLMATKNPRTKTISFKTKENQLMSINHGERQTLSSKVADIENLIPQHLGVSKSILNYVVFCHQDESLWPISESSVLKKKFDEIFDSSKFIKILDSIKGITKEINSDIKLINNDVEHLKNDKIRSVNKNNSIHLLEKQIETNRNLMVKLKSNLEQLNNELQKLYTSNQDYERTISQLESLEKDKANVMKNIETLKLTIDPINKPKELLLNDLNNFADVIADQIQKCNTLQNQIDGKIQELNELRKTLNTMHMQIGNFEALHKQNIDNINKKEEMIERFKQQLEIENVSQFDSKLDMKLQTLKENYDTQKKNYDDLLSTLENQLMDAKLEQSKEMQHLEYLQTDINSMSTKLNELKSRYASIAGNETKLQTLREEHDRKLAAFRKLKEMNEIANLNALIETDTKQINLFEFDLEENQRKLQMARINNDLMSKINVLKEINDSSNREMEVALLKILQIVPDISKSDLVSKYKELIESTEIAFNRKRADVETVKFKKSKAMMSLENNQQVETQYKSEMKKLSNHFKALQIQFKNIYGDNLELNKYLHTVDNVENDYNEDFEDFKNFQFLITFNERAIQTAENKTSCLLCRRTFDEENGDGGCGQKSKFVEMLKNRNLELVSRIGAEETLSRKEALLNKLRDFKGDSAKLVELETTKLAEVEKQIQENKQANFDLDTEIDLFSKELHEINDRLNKLKMIEQDVNIVNNQNSSIKDRTEQIQRLSNKLAEQGLTQENYEDLEKSNKQLYNDLKTARISLESLKLDRDMKQKRNNELENDINQVKLSINDLELKSLDKINIEKAISETETQLNSNINSYNDCKVKLNSFQENIESIQSKYSTQTNVSDNALIEARKEIENYDKIKKYFAKIDDEIQSYITNNIEAKFTQCSEIIKSGNENVEMKEGEITSLQHDLKKLEALVSNSSNQERNIRSNLNLMQLEEDLVSIASQINQLDATQAYVQRTNFLKRTSELQDVQNNYQKELATKLGESSQLERQIKEMKTELNRDYKDIDKKYVCEYAKLQTKLAMATDLTTLYKVTDNGVMEFHQSQMKKINNILDELWKKTYMGNDVETIKIKADPIAAKKTSTTTASNNRSYNYRVVMIKNGTELDMRGRCSAGQRVLASIIIRIALAECFCLNFGMIALDEPTTNLDDENIESLARALHAIIRERSTQRNFQLIIITHDEKFLRCMNAVDFTDHYYKVMRDERLNSTINKVSIATVTE